jgi:hypothetical protein
MNTGNLKARRTFPVEKPSILNPQAGMVESSQCALYSMDAQLISYTHTVNNTQCLSLSLLGDYSIHSTQWQVVATTGGLLIFLSLF